MTESRAGSKDELATAATWLFVPGDRPERFDKAARSGADQVILDLEDSVSSSNKNLARESVVRWLSAGNCAWARVNSVTDAEHGADIAALQNVPGTGLNGVVLAKATSAAVEGLTAHSGSFPGERRIVALVESADGIRDAYALAAHPSVVALAFGAIDYALDIDAADSIESLLYARSTLVNAARAAGLPGPIDGVCVDVRDADVAWAEATRSRSLGFAGKLCIHPGQVPAVAEAFAPSPQEVEWARRVETALQTIGESLATSDPAMAVALNGQMVDRPVILRARRVLSRAARVAEQR